MRSKVLKPVGSAPSEESYLEVRDVAHEEPQSESFLQEGKTSYDKELEDKVDVGKKSGDFDVEKKRQERRREVEESVEVFEESADRNRLNVQGKRVRNNIDAAEQASSEQLQRIRALQMSNRAASDVRKSVSEGKDIVYGNDSITNLLSMAINDAMMNYGKDDGYAEDHLHEGERLFGPKEGRKRTILVNGAMVTLDEDVAKEIVSKDVPDVGFLEKDVDGLDTDGLDAVRLAYLESEFSVLEANLERDRLEIENAFVAYRPHYKPVKYDYGMGLEADKPKRELPAFRWSDARNGYLPNGRRLPYVRYEDEPQLQMAL